MPSCLECLLCKGDTGLNFMWLKLPSAAKAFFFFLSLSVSGFCFKSPTLMWKRCPGTMCGQKAWQTHKENAQVKMGMLLHFSNEHVASSWYFMTLTQSKVHQYSLVISEYLCYSWQWCFPFHTSGDKPLLAQLLQLPSLTQQLTTVIPVKVNLWKVPGCWLC